MPETFHLAYVPGATPGKWAGVWRTRLPDVTLELVQVAPADAPVALQDGRADAAIARLPVDTEVFSRIPLYEEISVVCVHRDHFLAALDPDESVDPADLADETIWLPQDDVLFADAAVPGRPPAGPDGAPLEPPATADDALAIVGAGAGVTVLPMSLARLHHRKDVVFRPLGDGPTAPVGLVWPADRTTDLVEEMIGIVRGRTVNSSRGNARSRSAGEAGATQTGAVASERGRDAARGGKGKGKGQAPSHGRGHNSRRAAGGRGASSSSNRSGRNRRRKEK